MIAATEQLPQTTVESPILFDAVLHPYRSLSPRGFAILMTLLGSISFAAGFSFVALGAWPVFGFLGLDVALVYLAFRMNYRAARNFELVRLTENKLTVTLGGGPRIKHEIRVSAYWVRVEIDNSTNYEDQLILTSHGRSITVGAFLSPDERLDLARALQAELDRLRQPDLCADRFRRRRPTAIPRPARRCFRPPRPDPDLGFGVRADQDRRRRYSAAQSRGRPHRYRRAGAARGPGGGRTAAAPAAAAIGARWRQFLLLGMLGNGIPFVLIGYGETRIGSGLAAILIGTMPLITLLLAHLFAVERGLSHRAWAGIALGFVGLSVLLGPAALSEFHASSGTEVLAQLAIVLGGASMRPPPSMAACSASRCRCR